MKRPGAAREYWRQENCGQVIQERRETVMSLERVSRGVSEGGGVRVETRQNQQSKASKNTIP